MAEKAAIVSILSSSSEEKEKKRIRREREREEDDRISDLPDSAVDHILSFLTFKDAVRTTALSKQWKRKNPCCKLPHLDFTQQFFTHSWKLNSNITKKNKRALNVIDKILSRPRHQLGDPVIQTLRLIIPPMRFPVFAPIEDMNRCPLQMRLNRWMSLVAKPGLTVLDLNIQFRGHEKYDFPLAILEAAKTLKILSLSGFQLMPLSHGREVQVHVSFPSLHTLSLEYNYLNDFVIHKLLKAAPLLENLRIHCLYYGLNVLKVKGLNRLKTLDLSIYGNKNCVLNMIEIDSPNLSLLKIDGSPMVVLVPTCPKYLQQLYLTNICYSSWKWQWQSQGMLLSSTTNHTWFHRFLTMFPFLKHLTISSRIGLIENTMSLPTLNYLKTLNLHYFTIPDPLTFEINNNAPNLEKLCIFLTKKLPIVQLNASNKLDVEVVFKSSILPDEPSSLRHQQLATFFGSFNHSRSVKLSFGYDTFTPKDKYWNDVPSPLYATTNLDFKRSGKGRRFLEYIEYMLWLSPKATKLTIKEDTFFRDTTEMVLKCLHKKTNIPDTEASSCLRCKQFPESCWMHTLHEVIIEDFTGDPDDKENMKSFFRKKVKNLTFTEVSFDPVLNPIQSGLYAFYNQLFD